MTLHELLIILAAVLGLGLLRFGIPALVTWLIVTVLRAVARPESAQTTA
jgi:hypothetical protein